MKFCFYYKINLEMSKYDKEYIEKITGLQKEVNVKVDELEKYIDDIVKIRNKKDKSLNCLNKMMTLVIKVDSIIEECLKLCNDIKHISKLFDDEYINNNIDTAIIPKLEIIRNKNDEIKNMPISDMFRM